MHDVTPLSGARSLGSPEAVRSSRPPQPQALEAAWDDKWPARARCRDRPDEMFVKGAEQNRAKRICNHCPVRAECLAEALDGRIEWGVWGGMTEHERRAVLRRRPKVHSWRRLLEAARISGDEYAPAS